MKSISFRDMRLIPELSKFNEIQILHPKNDALMAKYLEQIGFNAENFIVYLPSNHRSMDGTVALGFRAVGDMSMQRKFINSPFSSLTERIIAAASTDVSLAQELCGLLGKSRAYTPTEEYEIIDGDDEMPADQLEPDWQFMQEQIRQLEDIRDGLRGTMFNAAGGLKCFSEYKT